MTAAPLARRITAQSAFEAAVILRNGEQLLVSLLFPVAALIALVWMPIGRIAGIDPIDSATPGILAMAIISSAFTSQAISTGFDRRNGVLRLAATTPLGRAGWLGGKVVAVGLIQLVQLIVIGGIALVLGWSPDVSGLPTAIAAWLLGTVAFTSLGLLLAGTARWEATLALANALFMVLVLAGGVLVPPADLPGVLAPLAEVLPSGPLAELLRGALTSFSGAPGAPGRVGHLVTLALWAVLTPIAVLRTFRWTS